MKTQQTGVPCRLERGCCTSDQRTAVGKELPTGTGSETGVRTGAAPISVVLWSCVFDHIGAGVVLIRPSTPVPERSAQSVAPWVVCTTCHCSPMRVTRKPYSGVMALIRTLGICTRRRAAAPCLVTQATVAPLNSTCRTQSRTPLKGGPPLQQPLHSAGMPMSAATERWAKAS